MANDAYGNHYNNITRDLQNLTRCVDDALLWENTIEENFMKTCQYLSLCAQNGITFNMKKFQFCQQEVEFMGFMLSNFGVRPTEEMLSSIKDFPRPRDVTGIRSFFGLVEQVAWAFSKTEEMAPF